MQEIYEPSKYPKGMLAKLKHMTPLAIEIANRWALGWPKGVQALIQSGEYINALSAAEEQERGALCNPNLSHLARHEMVELYGLSMAPPEASVPWGPYCGIGDDEDTENDLGAHQLKPPNSETPEKKRYGLTSFEVSEPYESNGKLIRSILSTHADGFVCLRFEDVETQDQLLSKSDDSKRI
jgi:hypothetical protein